MTHSRTGPIGLASVAGLTLPAQAQTPSFQYEIHGMPALWTPGQTATVTVLCGFSPGIGGMVNTAAGPRPVTGG